MLFVTIARCRRGRDAAGDDASTWTDRRARRGAQPRRPARPRDPRVAGHKAAALAALRAAGHPVPSGYVVSVGAIDDGDSEVDEGLRARLVEALDALGGGPVAVRSSGAAEDLAGRSYAGQYMTVLGVETLDGLCEAVRACIASGDSERVRTYGRAGPLAVLIQVQVPADAAGIAFSANPVTGDRGETLVSAVRGLGERLAAGEAAPDEWVVTDGVPAALASPEAAVTAEQARAVAALAERLESERGARQDVEWAVVDGEVMLFQSRPITALPRPPAIDPPAEGSWVKDVAHYPDPLTALGASVFLPAVDAGINAMFADHGVLIERIENRSIGGEVYGRLAPVGDNAGPPPPRWVLGLLARVMPPLRARMATARRVLREGRLEEAQRRWTEQWREEFRRASERLRGTDLTGLDDAALAAHLDEAIALLERGQWVHFRLFVPHVVGVYELAQTCRDLLGWEPIEALELLTGLSEASSEPAAALAELGARIQAHPALDAANHSSGERLELMRAEAPGLAAAFDEHLARYGHRTPNYDPGAPTLAERPTLAARLLHDAVTSSDRDRSAEPARRRAHARQRADHALQGRPAADRRRFEAALARAESVYGLREENVLWTDNLPSGLIRRAALEVGRRLAARGQLGRADEVADLEIDELRTGLSEPARDLSAPAARRRAERAWIAAHPGPPFYGDEPAEMPDVSALPPAGRRINVAMMWFMEQEYAPTARATDVGLGGTPGPSGRYTGPVRVLHGERDFDRLRPGDVLVAPVTTPSWSVLFTLAGAVVTDGGGTLSHAAVVAREHGIPAVLNAGEATSRLRDGQLVTVDGAAGTVHFVE